MSLLSYVITLMVGLFVGFKAPSWIVRTILYFYDKSELNSMTPQKADPDKICKGLHNWITANAITEKGKGTVKVCRLCGLVEGSDKSVSQETIDRIEENVKFREIEEKLYKGFVEQEDKDIADFFEAEIKGGLDFNKLVAIHEAGQTFARRYTIYQATKVEDIERELKKSDA